MNRCQICESDRVKILLDCPPQPLCNRFVADIGLEEYRHPLTLGQCQECALIQIIQPVPDEEIVPRLKWLSYKEPQDHIGDLADLIRSLPNITTDSIVCGISYKDDTLLEALAGRGLSRTWRIAPKEDLGIAIPGAGGETVQAYLTPDAAKRLVRQHGQADIIIARHIYEHASDTGRLLRAVKQLLAPSGYIVFEVPDCTEVLSARDYTMLWEEHILYFTPDTFKASFGLADLSLRHYRSYPYPVEDALVAIAQVGKDSKPTVLASDILGSELATGATYAGGLQGCAENVRRLLKEHRDAKGKIAVFGAGHLTCTYINLMGIGDYIDFVIDDNPNKKGLYMPGSCLPICGSDLLVSGEVDLCLLGLRPEAEPKIIERNKAFLDGGGTFASIFPTSKIRLGLLNCEGITK